MNRKHYRFELAIGMLLVLWIFSGCRNVHEMIQKGEFTGQHAITITLAAAVDPGWAKNPGNFLVYERQNPDIQIGVESVVLSPNGRVLTLKLAEPVNRDNPYVVTLKDIRVGGKSAGSADVLIRKSYAGYLFQILIGAMIIQNFVFSKYLGLCVFFGTSRKKSTAVGMGITFTIVICFASLMSWFCYQFVLKPFHLDYLQVVVFIGLVSLTVQGVDTILRKVNPRLFKAFGVYLVLVIANCIVIAVPLLLANHEYNVWESLMLALGAGLGFLIALFLMSSVRERLEFADIPKSYRGLPIAFIVAGLFALSFMGFSGMNLF